MKKQFVRDEIIKKTAHKTHTQTKQHTSTHLTLLEVGTEVTLTTTHFHYTVQVTTVLLKQVTLKTDKH